MSFLNPGFVRDVLNRDAPWSESHGAEGEFLGMGIMYYALVYSLRARVAICLGSGGGFVPRLMRQAQRDLGLVDSQTILVDAIMPEAGWGEPNWVQEGSFFRTHFAEVRVLPERTDVAFERFRTQGLRAEVIHIDADHSYKQARRDFEHASEILAPGGVISLHDTGPERAKHIPGMGVPRLVRWIRRTGAWDVMEFSEMAAGTAFVRRRARGASGILTRCRNLVGIV